MRNSKASAIRNALHAFRRFLLLPCISLYYYIIFVLHRFLFLLFNKESASSLYENAWKAILTWSFSVDAVPSAALTILPSFIVLLSAFGIKSQKVLKLYVVLSSCLLAVIHVADLVIYSFWNQRLGTTAFTMLSFPSAISSNLSWSLVLQIALVTPLVLAAPALLIRFVLFPRIDRTELDGGCRPNEIPFIILTLFLSLFVGISFLRKTGDYNFWEKLMTMQKNNVVFANSARENPTLNFLNFVFTFEDEDALSCKFPEDIDFSADDSNGSDFPATKGEAPGDVAGSVLRTNRPNIILVLSESFSSDIIGKFNPGSFSLTPRFDELADEGLLFSNFYANTRGTPGAIGNIVAATPTMTKYAYAFSDSNFLKELAKTGYSTSFYYGGDINLFGNELFFKNIGFNDTYHKGNFFRNPHSSWGTPDEDFFKIAFEHLERSSASKRPFFSLLLTLSNHIPFDIPDTYHSVPCTDNCPENITSELASAISYSDHAFGSFIDNLKKSSLWEDTLVIFVADHGRHQSPYPIDDLRRYRIPMLWLGGALADHGEIKSLGDQSDIGGTVLAQLGIDTGNLMFSDDILRTTDGFSALDMRTTNLAAFILVHKDNSMILFCNTASNSEPGSSTMRTGSWKYLKRLLDYRQKCIEAQRSSIL